MRPLGRRLHRAALRPVYQPSLPQVASQARLEPDVLDPHPGSTAGYHHQS